MEVAYQAGLVVQPSPGAVPRFKRYLDDQRGEPLGDVWTDIPPVNSQAAERLGYPTQKPLALAERFILASSNPGDLVLDPFCGCGTTVVAAQRLDRRWIGIDITSLAIALIKNRLRDTFGDSAAFQVIGEPVSLPDAQTLADQDKYQFQSWALGLVEARPIEQKKGSDKGIDRWLYFHDEAEGARPSRSSCQSRPATPTSPTSAICAAFSNARKPRSASSSPCKSQPSPCGPKQPAPASTAPPGWNQNYPKIQILTIADLLEGHGIDMPPLRQVSTTFKKAPRTKDDTDRQLSMNIP
jgi:hypothetical protein